jgi:hypothetical protein
VSKPIQAEISKDGKAVDLKFDYDPHVVERVKEISSWRFVGETKKRGAPKVWRVDLDLATMRRLREKLGDDLEIRPKLNEWGHNEVAYERNLVDLSTADDAKLLHVPEPLIKGAKNREGDDFKLRPYQRADIAFMAQGRSINANQPGSGKTSEWVCAMMEAELTWGQHLVLAPVTSLELVWEEEIKDLYRMAGLDSPTIFTGDTPAARKRAVKEALEFAEDGLAFWLVLNPHMAQYKSEMNAEALELIAEAEKIEDERERLNVLGAYYESIKNDDMYDYYFANPELTEIDFDSMCVDEFHLCGLSEPGTQTAQGINRIAGECEPDMRCAMSGTPMGGKPIKLWGALHFIEPQKFTSKWKWARQWLEVTKVGDTESREIEGVQLGREVEFDEHLKQWLIRRTKEEILPHLPPKNRINVWCGMTKRQQEQYRVFERDAEWRIADEEEATGRLSATNVLSEYMRLKQFASAYCDVTDSGILNKSGMPKIEVKATTDSGKYAQLIEKLEEHQVIGGEESALVFSQFNGVIEFGVVEILSAKKIPHEIITGAVKGKNRKAVVQAFQQQEVAFLEDWESKSPLIERLIKNGPPRVLVLNTKAGGTTLTLSEAKSVHILDETWNPDDQEQDEDRAHRGDKKTEEKLEVPIYYYRTKGTIEEYIKDVNDDKSWNNERVLSLRRRAREAAEQREKASVDEG